MKHLENYSNVKLKQLQQICNAITTSQPDQRLIDIATIALVEINRELDMIKLRKAGKAGMAQ